jgi:protein-S-isoprenylcysteine O-methyltransferase Ste14
VQRLKRVLLWGDVAFYLTVLAAAAMRRPRTVHWFAGLGIAALAYPLWIAARVQLGTAFSIWPEARQLVTSGLYSKLRHPVYVFGTLASLSSLLVLQVWPILLFGLALIPITISRMRREEKLLAARFGEEYERYRARTWF